VYLRVFTCICVCVSAIYIRTDAQVAAGYYNGNNSGGGGGRSMCRGQFQFIGGGGDGS